MRREWDYLALSPAELAGRLADAAKMAVSPAPIVGATPEPKKASAKPTAPKAVPRLDVFVSLARACQAPGALLPVKREFAHERGSVAIRARPVAMIGGVERSQRSLGSCEIVEPEHSFQPDGVAIGYQRSRVAVLVVHLQSRRSQNAGDVSERRRLGGNQPLAQILLDAPKLA